MRLSNAKYSQVGPLPAHASHCYNACTRTIQPFRAFRFLPFGPQIAKNARPNASAVCRGVCDVIVRVWGTQKDAFDRFPGTGGVYSALGGGFADLPSAHLLRHHAATEVTGGSVGSPSSATALLKGPLGYTVLAMVNALIGIAALAEGVQDWFLGQTSRIVRVTADRCRVADGIGVARVIAVVLMLKLRKS
jgi:hypothetical protein